MEVNKKILFIDDQQEILDSLKKLFTGKESLKHITNKLDELVKDFFEEEEAEEEEIYDVYIANRGEHGFQLVKEAIEINEPFSMVTIDMRMPGWDGLKTAKEIRIIDPNIEIVIVTAYTDRNREEILESVGTPEKLLYIKKPFDREEILQVALSLTIKWTLEQEVNKQLNLITKTKEGLENMISGINYIEKINPSELNSILNSILKQTVEILDLKDAYIELVSHIGNIKDNIGNLEIKEETLKEIEMLCKNKKEYFVYNNYIILPFINEEGIRVTAILKNSTNRVFSENDAKFLKIFASHANNIIKNSYLYMKLEDANKELLKKNEKLKMANELNKKFLVISSHELRTPITLISGYSQLLENNIYSSEEEKEKMYKGLRSSSIRLTKIINSMLEVFAMTDKKSDIIIKKEHCKIEEIFKEFREKVQYFIEVRKQKLILEKNDIESLYIDKKKIMDFVLFNLIMNSIKSSKDGKEIKVELKKSLDEKKVLVSVIDEGTGIPNEDLENIYSPFFVSGDEKYHHSGIYEYKSAGIGLGLTIVKNIMEILGEEIYCKTEEGKGTTFTFTISL